MKNHNFLLQFAFFLAILVKLNLSSAKSEEQPNLCKTHQWMTFLVQIQETQFKISAAVLLSGALCFVAAAISSAGGIGGGGLFIPILSIVAGLDLKTASSFSTFMVTGGSLANVLYNLLVTARSEKFGGKSLIDYDIAILSEPCMLLGVSIGVICNVVFPEWLITVLFVVFLAWSTFRTCKNGVLYWKLESEGVRRNGFGELENGLVRNGSNSCGNEGIENMKEELLARKEEKKFGFPWLKMGVLILVWFSFFVLYILRGNRYGQGITPMEPCGIGYWTLSSLQIPLAVAFTTWMLYKKETPYCQTPTHEDTEHLTSGAPCNKLVFPLMALLAGILGGMFGIGGGMLISPLLLQVGIAPEATAATCSFMVFFSSTMSAFQYLLLGMEHTSTALVFAIICFVSSLIGLLVVQRAVKELGRASLIVFSVSIVMALSTVLITSFGAVDVWKDFTAGNYMGFKLPC